MDRPDEPKEAHMVATIQRALDVYDAATPDQREAGRAWYPDAQRLARRLGPTLHRGAGLIAATSVNAEWKANVTMAQTIRETGTPYGLPIVRKYTGAILGGARPMDVLTGPKVGPFCMAIATGGKKGPGVIDRWMKRALDEMNIARCQEALEYAAWLRDERVHDMQAIIWIVVRGGAA